MIADIFNVITGIFKSIKAIGSLHNSTGPVLSFIDGITKCNDFSILKHKPKEEDMADKMIYFYGHNSFDGRESNRIYYIDKGMGYNNPVEITRKDFAQFKDFKGDAVFDKILAKINGKKSDLSILSKGAVYKFLFSKGRFAAGIKYAFHSRVALPYRKFEKNFIAKFPKIYKAYSKVRQAFVNLCVFAVSETGVRILGIIVATGLAVVSGGMFFAVAAGAYAVGISVAVSRQAMQKLDLNRLKEEANLLERYAVTYKNKILVSQGKNIFFKDNFIKAPVKIENLPTGIKKWALAGFKYLSTYGLELGVPVATVALSPIPALLQFSIMTGSAAITSGVGIYFKKSEDDKKRILKEAILDAKTHNFIPDYSSTNELKEYVKLQENQLLALDKVKVGLGRAEAIKAFEKNLKTMDGNIPQVSFFKEYRSALYEVLNPFDRTKEIKDFREVAGAVKYLNDAIKMNDLYKQESIPLTINLSNKINGLELRGIKHDLSKVNHKGIYSNVAQHQERSQ